MQNSMTKQEIKDEIERLGPFHHKVQLPYGLSTYNPDLSRRNIEYTRVDNLVRHAFPPLLQICGGSLRGKYVLDVGCCCGGFSVEAAKLGAEYVLGIDIVDHYIEQANFIKRAFGLSQLDFKRMDVEDLDESIVGQYDITFCLGLLYHLENPIVTMRRISSVTRCIMVVDTTVVRIPFVQRPIWVMNFPPIATSNSRNVSTSLWRTKRVCQFAPSANAVTELLKFLGFSNVVRLRPKEKGLEKRYYKGKRATFLAVR